MKIEIEFDNSYSARMVIDGRELRVETKANGVHLTGVKGPETDGTLGGIVARELYGFVSQIQQAWATADDEGAGTWDRLEEDVADDISGGLF